MEIKSKLDEVLRDAEKRGSWPGYAVYVLGNADSGEPELDAALADLYIANETVYRIANKLALRNDLELYEGE